MAGEWIKMRADLPDDPAVFTLAARLKLNRDLVVGKLFRFWAWADKHATNGRIADATPEVVDEIVGVKGFANALLVASWLRVRDDGLELPNWDRHNGESAKERAQKNRRQARWRSKSASTVDGTGDANVDGAASTKPSTREEKRREDTSGVATSPLVVAVDNSTPDGDKSPENPKTATRTPLPAGWHRSNDGIEAASRITGITARPGEDYPSLKDRIFKAIYAEQRAQA